MIGQSELVTELEWRQLNKTEVIAIIFRLVHKKEKKFRCNYRDYSYAKQSDMKKHNKVEESGEKERGVKEWIGQKVLNLNRQYFTQTKTMKKFDDSLGSSLNKIPEQNETDYGRKHKNGPSVDDADGDEDDNNETDGAVNDDEATDGNEKDVNDDDEMDDAAEEDDNEVDEMTNDDTDEAADDDETDGDENKKTHEESETHDDDGEENIDKEEEIILRSSGRCKEFSLSFAARQDWAQRWRCSQLWTRELATRACYGLTPSDGTLANDDNI